METVTIPRSEYESLQEDSFKLSCLENAEVDNDFAMEEYYDGMDTDDT